ncbi:MAG: hypothetical protein LBK27_00860 [Treponema sp.]|nr:hypothetical protein [Treponema sp.]
MNKTPEPARRRLLSAVPAVLIGFLGLFAFSACDQSAIFFAISQEPALREPQIVGSPTNIVTWHDGTSDSVYVANRAAVHKYNAGGWDKLPHPGGAIWSLAATSTGLYILTSGNVKKYDTGTRTWKTVPNNSPYKTTHTIYADSASSRLFAGAGDGTNTASSKDYAILYLNNSGELDPLDAGGDRVHILTGAALDGSGNHYLSTAGSGIFRIAEADLTSLPLTPVTDGAGISYGNIKGIIFKSLGGLPNDLLIAVKRSGSVLLYNGTEFVEKCKLDANNYESTGSLAFWLSPGTSGNPTLLLAGIQGSKSSLDQINTNGYREIRLDNWAVHAPGKDSPTSAPNADKYNSSLGKHPITHLFQIPASIDPKMTVFASTINQGLWSYRDHGDGELIWNAE